MKKLSLITLFLITSSLALSCLAKPAKLAVCAACHGTNGVGTAPIYPNLNGQKKAYLLKQLQAFKSGLRKDPAMAPMAKILSDKDMEELASYYSKLK